MPLFPISSSRLSSKGGVSILGVREVRSSCFTQFLDKLFGYKNRGEVVKNSKIRPKTADCLGKTENN